VTATEVATAPAAAVAEPAAAGVTADIAAQLAAAPLAPCGRVAELPAGVAAGPVVAAVGRGSGRGRAPRPGHHRADQEAGEQPVHGVAAVVAVGVGAVRRATLVPRNHAVAVAHLPGVGLGA